MRWSQAEYILKGIFLGLLAFAALQEPDWTKTGQLALYLLGGLGAGLLLSLVLWIVRGLRISGRVLSLIVFLILESPTLVYLGLIGGLFLGALAVRNPARHDSLLPICVGAGALLGVAMGELRRIGPDRDREMIVHCKSGMRSAKAVHFLREQGFRTVKNLKGGILAWADKIDPAMPKY